MMLEVTRLNNVLKRRGHLVVGLLIPPYCARIQITPSVMNRGSVSWHNLEESVALKFSKN